jgi:hypothetical protein
MARALVNPDEAWRAVMITADEVLADPAASDWLKRSLLSALKRNPVDAVNDAQASLPVRRRRVAAIECPDAISAILSPPRAGPGVAGQPLEPNHLPALRQSRAVATVIG